jgi:hypothetical protein
LWVIERWQAVHQGPNRSSYTAPLLSNPTWRRVKVLAILKTGSGRLVGYPYMTPIFEFCLDWRSSGRWPRRFCFSGSQEQLLEIVVNRRASIIGLRIFHGLGLQLEVPLCRRSSDSSCRLGADLIACHHVPVFNLLFSGNFGFNACPSGSGQTCFWCVAPQHRMR